jgi:hypothetical protein
VPTPPPIRETAEGRRLEEARTGSQPWRRWGPYVSARQWGTVREDYSPNGTAWDSFPHDDARSRAYRWGEDGLAGISDEHQRLCFAIALWNGEDDILKERPFGLTNGEGNHGEDVKEYYFYLDNTPTHAYMKYLYKYPWARFPYADLVAENGRRKADPRRGEYELLDTGVFDGGRYFDVLVEYAKSSPDDILIRLSATNRGPDRRTLHLLPTLWFRNTWSWSPGATPTKPSLSASSAASGSSSIEASAVDTLAARTLYCQGDPELWFTENESNHERLGWGSNPSPYVKDAFHAVLVNGRADAVNPAHTGTKAAAHYQLDLAPGETATVLLRLSDAPRLAAPFDTGAVAVMDQRQREADDFYAAVTPFPLSDDMRSVQRQAFAGLLWNKQYYGYVIRDWLAGDAAGPPPPPERRTGRNRDWLHLHADDVISMPDNWEYPWFAAWDLAFHSVALALIDPELAKSQLLLLTHEWYLHPNGQVPAYEWAFDDLNPPVQAWAAWRVYEIEQKMYGQGDREFLERIFQKLTLYFTWWMNREDRAGNDIFQGGFLGLDNIGVFNRSNVPQSVGGYVDQADGSSWMAMYCLNLLRIALELAVQDSTYESMASKFMQNFFYIAEAINRLGENDESLWDDQDGFYYDSLHLTDGRQIGGREYLELKVRSMVGLVPLFAIEGIETLTLSSPQLSEFKARYQWFRDNRPELTSHDTVSLATASSALGEWQSFALVRPERVQRILQKVLDENEFLSPHGLRALSRFHAANPFVLPGLSGSSGVEYTPGESTSGDFGGNSNWRGPVWFPVNYLLIEALQKYHRYFGDDLKVEFPTGSGQHMTLWEVAAELSRRLINLFLRDAAGSRPVNGTAQIFHDDPHWADLVLFYEYFHGDTGAGLGASHQTGWTALVAKLIQQWSEYAGQGRPPDVTA